VPRVRYLFPSSFSFSLFSPQWIALHDDTFSSFFFFFFSSVSSVPHSTAQHVPFPFPFHAASPSPLLFSSSLLSIFTGAHPNRKRERERERERERATERFRERDLEVRFFRWLVGELENTISGDWVMRFLELWWLGHRRGVEAMAGQ
jgi:hypothetical protein